MNEQLTQQVVTPDEDVFAWRVQNEHGDEIGMVHRDARLDGAYVGFLFSPPLANRPPSRLAVYGGLAGYIRHLPNGNRRTSFVPIERDALRFLSREEGAQAVRIAAEWRANLMASAAWNHGRNPECIKEDVTP